MKGKICPCCGHFAFFEDCAHNGDMVMDQYGYTLKLYTHVDADCDSTMTDKIITDEVFYTLEEALFNRSF